MWGRAVAAVTAATTTITVPTAPLCLVIVFCLGGLLLLLLLPLPLRALPLSAPPRQATTSATTTTAEGSPLLLPPPRCRSRFDRTWLAGRASCPKAGRLREAAGRAEGSGRCSSRALGCDPTSSLASLSDATPPRTTHPKAGVTRHGTRHCTQHRAQTGAHIRLDMIEVRIAFGCLNAARRSTNYELYSTRGCVLDSPDLRYKATT